MDKIPKKIVIFNKRKDKKFYLKNISPIDLIDLIKYNKLIDDVYLPILIEELKILINKNQYNKLIILAINYSKSYSLFNYLTEDEFLKLNPYYKQNGNFFCNHINSYLYNYIMYFLRLKKADKKLIELIALQKNKKHNYCFLYINIIKNLRKNILVNGINYIIIKAFCSLNNWALKTETIGDLNDWYNIINEHKDIICNDKKILLRLINVFIDILLKDDYHYYFYVNSLINIMKKDITNIQLNKNILNKLRQDDINTINNIMLNKKIYKKLLKG